MVGEIIPESRATSPGIRNKSVPLVELDQRARDARLQLERIERLLVPRGAVIALWFRRVLCLFSFAEPGDRSRASRIRGPLTNRRPRMPHFPRGWAPSAG
jgi:hypothetical protein